jgi:hypothetical protein
MFCGWSLVVNARVSYWQCYGGLCYAPYNHQWYDHGPFTVSFFDGWAGV